jgi:hypothetical protein
VKRFPGERGTGRRQGHRWAARSVGILVGLCALGVSGAASEEEEKQAPTVFHAAGPSVGAIQCAVDQFRTALGEPHHANTPGPLASGRREINGHGGGSRLHQFAHLHLALSRAGFDVRLRVEPLEGRPPRRTRRRCPVATEARSAGPRVAT